LLPSVESKGRYLKEGPVNIVFAIIKAIYSYVNSFVHIRMIKGLRLLAVGVGLWMVGLSVWGQTCPTNPPTNVSVDRNNLCSDDAGLIVLSYAGGNGETLTWYEGGCGTGSVIGTGNNLTIASPATTTTYFARWESVDCNPSSCASIQVIVIPVITPVINNFSINPGTTICAGTNVTFSVTVGNGGTNPIYQWLLNGNPVGTNSPTFTSSTLVNTDQVRVRVTSDAACPATVESNTITMTVNDLRQHSVTITASANNICPGNQVTFTATPINGGTSTVYVWYLNDNPVANTATYSSTTLNNGDRIYVETTSSATCPDPPTARSNTIEMTVRPGIPETPGNISGDVAVCPATSGHVYSISDVTNATSYTWSVPSGWNIISGQGSTSITVTSGLYGQDGTISVTASNSCGTSPAGTLAVTVNPGTPAVPGTINGSGTVCPNTAGLIYSIEDVTHATTYTWTVPTGWGITGGQGTNTITVTSGATGQNGNISVTAGNQCGISSARTLAVTVGTLSVIPTSITVTNNSTCFGTSKTLTVNGGSLGTGSEWHWYTALCGGTAAGTGPTISVNPPAGTTTAYYVRAEGQCNTTECISTDVVVLPAAPVQPGIITGPTPVCPGTAGLTYTIESVANAASYTWTVPTGWTITSGQGTTSIIVTAGNYGQNGNITVTASNSCGSGPAQTLGVLVSPGVPSTPGPISGATEQCINRTGLTYSIQPVQYATSYVWAVPDGWQITSGQGTTSITASTTGTAVSGNITVYAGNTCGQSNLSLLAVNVISTVLSAPGPISGLTAICPTRTTTYSIDPVPGAVYYTWTVPGNWNITNGQGTDSITVDVLINSQSGNVTVSANNACGSSVPSTLNVSVANTATVYAGPDQVVCYGTASVQLNGQVGGAIRPNQHNEWDWIALSGGTFSNDRILTPQYNFPNGGNTTGTLTVRLQSNVSEVGCPYASDDMLITILPIPVVNDPVDQVVCNGTPTSAVILTGTGTSYTWANNNTSIGLAASGTGNIPSFTAINTGSSPQTATITVTPINSLGGTSCSGTPQTFTITVNPTPTVINPSDQAVCNGALTSAVNFTGTATSYTWININTSIGLASSGTGNIPSFTANNTGNTIITATITVTPVYSNAGISCSGTPQTFTISVAPTPAVDDPIDQTVCNGSVTSAINFTGISTSFTWTNDNTAIGLAATGTGNIPSFTAINTGSTPQIATVTVTPVYSNGVTNCNGTPQTFTITVNPTPDPDAGPDMAGCSNLPIQLNGTLTGGSSSIWSGGSGSFSDPTILNPTYTPGPADIAARTVTLTLTAIDPAGLCPDVSDMVTITINRAVVITTQPSNVGVCSSFPADLGVVVTGDNPSYQWYRGTPPTGTPLTPSANISGVNSNILHFNQATLADAGSYYVVVSGAAGCSPVTSNVVTLNVDQAITITQQPQSQTVCAGGNVTFSVTADAGGDPLTYVWRRNGTPIPGAPNTPAYTINNISQADAGSYDVLISGTAGYQCSSVQSQVAVLTVNPIPDVTATPSAPAICSGTAPSIALTGSVPGTTFSWTVTQTGVTGASDGSGSTINQTLTTTGNANGTAVYRVTPAANGCQGEPIDVTVTVNPTPSATPPDSQTFCNGLSTIPINLTGSPA